MITKKQCGSLADPDSPMRLALNKLELAQAVLIHKNPDDLKFLPGFIKDAIADLKNGIAAGDQGKGTAAAPGAGLTLIRALNAVDAEPEFPGEPPPEMVEALRGCDQDTAVYALRLAVRMTKDGIQERLRAAVAPAPPDEAPAPASPGSVQAPSAGPLSSRLRPDIECAPWVIEAVKKLEAALAGAPSAGRPMTWTRERPKGNKWYFQAIYNPTNEQIGKWEPVRGDETPKTAPRLLTKAGYEYIYSTYPLPEPETSASESGEPVSGDPAQTHKPREWELANLTESEHHPLTIVQGELVKPGESIFVREFQAPIVEAKADPAQGVEIFPAGTERLLGAILGPLENYMDDPEGLPRPNCVVNAEVVIGQILADKASMKSTAQGKEGAA